MLKISNKVYGLKLDKVEFVSKPEEMIHGVQLREVFLWKKL